MGKKILIGIGVFFALASIVFTILPLGTLAVIPIGVTAFFAFFAFRNATGKQWHAARLLLVVSGLLLVIVIGREFLIEDKIEADHQFELKKAESEKEDIKQLEELEGLE